MDVLVSWEHDCMEAGGTIPWKESVESSQERRPRVKQDARTEEQLPRMLRENDPTW